MTGSTYVIIVSLLGVVWGGIERINKRFRGGQYLATLGRDGTGMAIGIAQGVISIAIFALIGLGFWLFNWKIALASLVFSLVAGALAS